MENLAQYNGIFFRPGTSDRGVIGQCLKNYKHFTFDSESIVCDFGGNIGAFGKMALDAGCKELHIFEPDEENFKMIEINLLQYNHREACVFFYNTAVSTSNEQTLTFYKTDSKSSDCSGTIQPFSIRSEKMRPVRAIVKNTNINKVLKVLKPTHLKIDIEGSEIDWIKENNGEIPDCVEEFFIEIHKRLDFLQIFDSEYFPKIKEKFDIIHLDLTQQGFDTENRLFLPNLGIDTKKNVLGIEILFKRKHL